MINPVPEQPFGEPKKLWFPHEHSWTETPFLFFLAKVLPYWIRIRNVFIRNPLVSWRLPIPCIPSLNASFTLGELIVLIVGFFGTIAYCVLVIVLDVDYETTGSLACIPMLLTYMLATHNSIFTFLFGIPFERALFWHKFGALITVAASWVHGIPCILYKDTPHHQDDILTGYGFTIPMTALLVLSLSPIRRHFWNGFYFIHIVVVIAVIPIALLHEAGVVLIGVGFWAFDLIFRGVYLTMLRNPHKATAKRLPANIIRFTFPKGNFEYSAGQYVFIMVPKVNIFEWHPFSISSSPHHKTVAIHVRVLGNWTKALYDKIEGETELTVYMEGPYGAPEIDTENEDYKLFLLVSGGIGITPMQSLCNTLVNQHENEGRALDKIWFVWSCADKYMVSAAFEHDREWAGVTNNDSTRLPFSFQPDDLKRLNSIPDLAERKPVKKDNYMKASVDDVLHTEFYLTRVRNAEGYADANIRPELQQFLKFGRPKLPEIFTTMAAYAQLQGQRRVATMVCGPVPMVNDVRRLCSEFSDRHVRFDFHSEVFEF